MAQTKILYTDKVTVTPQPSIPDVNKVTGDDMTEIKTVVNDNADDTQSQLDNKVEGVTGLKVDNTDPLNPVIDPTTKSDVGLGDVPNTDFTIPVSNNTNKVSFPEAPVDGKSYARKDAAWEEAVSTIPNASFDTVGGVKMSRNSATSTTYISFDGSDTPNVA